MEKILSKKKTHIEGLDRITFGGLPENRITLICGKQGCGKSVFAQEFLVNGARYENEPGLLVSFEEPVHDILKNMRTFNWDVDSLIKKKLLHVTYIPVESQKILEDGAYSLDGLFIQLDTLLKKTGAKRLALDTIEAIFAGFQNHHILRAEIARLFQWLREHNVTSIITGEQGNNSLTRFQLEEYVSDAVIQLQMQVKEDIITRKLAVLKYRGSKTGMNLYPFSITENGISLLPITVQGLSYKVSDEFTSTGIPLVDEMLDGKGIYKGSIVLLSGNAGTGKTTFAGMFAYYHAQKNRKVVYVSTEESYYQLFRNYNSFGMDFKSLLEQNKVYFYSERPSYEGIEEHLMRFKRIIQEFKPDVFIVDPVSNLITIGNPLQVRIMLTRFIDFLRAQGTTGLFVDFNQNEKIDQGTGLTISSMVDTWIALYNRQINGKFQREIIVLKSRGVAHTNESRAFQISSKGIEALNKK